MSRQFRKPKSDRNAARWTPDQSKPKAKIVARLTAAQATAAHLLDATLHQILGA